MQESHLASTEVPPLNSISMDESTETMELSPSSTFNTHLDTFGVPNRANRSRWNSAESLESSTHMPSLALFRGDSFTARPQTPSNEEMDILDYPNPFLVQPLNTNHDHVTSPQYPAIGRDASLHHVTTNKENRDPIMNRSLPNKILFASSHDALSIEDEDDVTVEISPVPSSPNLSVNARSSQRLMSAGRKRNSSELLDSLSTSSETSSIPESVTLPFLNNNNSSSSKWIKHVHPFAPVEDTSSAGPPLLNPPPSARKDRNQPAFRTFRTTSRMIESTTSSFDSMDSSMSHNSSLFPNIGTTHTTTSGAFGEPLGFPAREGQYAFTGSPIDEKTHKGAFSEYDLEEESHKVRRLNLDCSMEDGSGEEGCGSIYNHMQKGRSTNESHTKVQMKSSRISFFSPPEQSNKDDQEISPKDVADLRAFSSTPSPLSTNFIPQPIFQSPPVTQRKGLDSVQPPPSPRRIRHESSYTYAPSPKTPRVPHKSHRRHLGHPSSKSSQDNDNSTQPPRSRFEDDFDILGTLGTGSFGTVYKCLSKLDGCTYAIKAAKRQARGALDKKRMLNEVFALAALSDVAEPRGFHIVRYHQAWMEENRLYIQTELCTSTLLQEIRSGMFRIENGLEEVMKRSYTVLREILLALDLIHKHGLVHLDIKPENIFIKGGQYKLGDFGLVCKSNVQGDIDEGDSKYMCKDLLSGNHEDLTKVRIIFFD
jgi:tRNA A-37 threonylcarbamoyl transferase component Bud32